MCFRAGWAPIRRLALQRGVQRAIELDRVTRSRDREHPLAPANEIEQHRGEVLVA
jgi:hypothetical protein